MLSKKKIIVFEDDDLIRSVHVAKFEKADFDVIAFRYPSKDAIDIIIKERPDLISLDTIMPRKDGFTLLGELKSDSRTKHIPVCMLSNLGEEENIEKGLKLGATKYLVLAQYTHDQIIDIFREIIGLPPLLFPQKSDGNSKMAVPDPHFPPYATFPSDEEINKQKSRDTKNTATHSIRSSSWLFEFRNTNLAQKALKIFVWLTIVYIIGGLVYLLGSFFGCYFNILNKDTCIKAGYFSCPEEVCGRPDGSIPEIF